jgi:chromosome segregation protein
LDLVRVDSPYHAVAESLLGEVWLVPDLATALALYRKNGVHVTFVTPQGDVVHPSGVITGGSDRPIEEEILSRRREMETLRAAHATADAQLGAVRAELATLAQGVAETEAALKALDDGVHALMMEIVGIEKDLERLTLEQPQCTSRLEVLRFETEQLRSEDQAAATEIEGQQQRLQALAQDHERLEQAAADLRVAVAGAQEHADGLSSTVTAGKVRVAECREREHAAAATVAGIRQQVLDAVTRIERAHQELEATTRARAELDVSIRALEAKVLDQVAQREALQAEVADAATRVETVALAYRDAVQRVRETQLRVDELREQRVQREVSRSELRMRLEHLIEAMREKYATELGEATETEEPAIDLAAAAERLEPLKTRLARLGDVNVGAIDELREFGERSAELRTQRDDLQHALGHLERTIQKLNRASRTRFAETFAKANEIFQQVFPRLFRGGEARLVLTNEDDLLETGVEIVVRPPGKRLDSVALLSGGERALVAVSLIFSLFLINPAPFCILDEVDAPLDDANVGRFNQMVREMSAQSQFIIVTHNKRSMESADVLYGVTMQEPGVSKVISVSMS